MKQTFNAKMATAVIKEILFEIGNVSVDLGSSFIEICKFLDSNPEALSWKKKACASIYEKEGLQNLAQKYVDGYFRSDFPATPGTVPDEMISIVLRIAYGYAASDTERIKVEHQHSMCAENCVGALLERYIDSELRSKRWVWCCGDFIKAVDFIYPKKSGWDALQIKNRNNTENSSSSSVRNNTTINKWFRTFSQTGKTNWATFPMPKHGLSEDGFTSFVKTYLAQEKEKLGR